MYRNIFHFQHWLLCTVYATPGQVPGRGVVSVDSVARDVVSVVAVVAFLGIEDTCSMHFFFICF